MIRANAPTIISLGVDLIAELAKAPDQLPAAMANEIAELDEESRAQLEMFLQGAAAERQRAESCGDRGQVSMVLRKDLERIRTDLAHTNAEAVDNRRKLDQARSDIRSKNMHIAGLAACCAFLFLLLGLAVFVGNERAANDADMARLGMEIR